MCESNQSCEQVTNDELIEALLVMSLTMKILAKKLMLQSVKQSNRKGGTPNGKM